MRAAWCALCVAAVACDRTPASAPPPPPGEAPVHLIGVRPRDFQCPSLLPVETLSKILGAPARLVDSAASTPTGVAAPCTYLVAAAEQEAWTFDIDCRDGMSARAEALFAQYERTSDELVELAARAPSAGTAAPSTGPAATPSDGHVRRKPARAFAVDVGGKGLDHHGQGLIFIDDDAPCYVRVVGPDAAHRLAIARHLAAELTPVNAPMAPRPAPR